MPNELTSTGLTVKTQTELRNELINQFQNIYGSDIDLSSDTPDGQIIMIFVQAVIDILDLLVQVYNSFNPESAIGVSLDRLCAINGIQRQAGTFTITDISITVDRALTLYGLDQDVEDVYTVKDSVGNEWQLIDTQTPGGAGTNAYAFQAKEPGEVFTTPNTITIPVTVVLGVTAINNPTSYTTLGLNEESDIALRIRRQRSVSLSSQGYLQGLLAALLNIEGMAFARVYENNTNTTDADGIPSHSIWVIVSGTATDENIANAIYQKRNAGVGMKGTETFEVTQPDGSLFEIKWDEVTTVDLYIEFDMESIDGSSIPSASDVKDYIVENLQPDVFETMNINDLATIVQDFDPNILVTEAGFSLSAMGPFTEKLTPSAKNEQFTIEATNIDITVV